MVDSPSAGPREGRPERPPPDAQPVAPSGAAIGGEPACSHPDETIEPLGLGAPLRFERCGRCGAVLVTGLGGQG